MLDISQFKSLKEIHEHYAIHNSCKLKKIATQPVYEITPPKSGLVFVGEAPGMNEDKQGKPFVGEAGKLLDELLKGIGLSRDDVYVTNTVKYRPPQNRDPLPEEKSACRVWLNAELIFLKPKVIIPLGKHALETFLPGLKISSARGTPYEHVSHIPIFPIYHPAVALYNPNLKEDLIKDFKRLDLFLKGRISLEKHITEDKGISKERRSLLDDILKL